MFCEIALYGRSGVPLQLQIYSAKMLDLTYSGIAEIEGNYIRMGIKFNASGKRVVYHFGSIILMIAAH